MIQRERDRNAIFAYEKVMQNVLSRDKNSFTFQWMQFRGACWFESDRPRTTCCCNVSSWTISRLTTLSADSLPQLDMPWLHDTLSKLRTASLARLSTPLNGVQESLLLAGAILKYYFGQDWLNKYLLPDATKPNYLRIVADTISQDRTALRAIDLAEMIYNLQHLRGFDECIAKMRNGDIEGTYAELDLGRMLYLYKVPFRYVVPQRIKKGQDYDVEIEYSDGVIARAEAKCNIESTMFGESTIRNKLDSARKQLPPDRPGIVFVKVPPKWMDENEFFKMTNNVAQSFLRGTRRIVSVKFYVSPISVEGDYTKQRHAYKEISNPDTNFGAKKNWDLFYKMDLPPEYNGMPPHWQRVLFFPDGKMR
jgi:hypothetical protein